MDSYDISVAHIIVLWVLRFLTLGYKVCTVKLGDKEHFDKEQIGV